MHAPDLWTDVWIDDTSVAAVYLERSQTLPINATLPYNPRDSVEEAVDVIKPHVQRVRTLWASFDCPDDLVGFAGALDVEVPNLETLSLGVDEINSTEEFHCSPQFMARFPKLRDLVLVNITDAVVHGPLRNLNTLSLSGVLPPLGILLDLLRHSSTLTDLMIVGEQPWDTEPKDVAKPIVELPQLNALTLFIDPPYAVVHMLSCLRFPPSTPFSVNLVVSEDDIITDMPDPRLPHAEGLRQVSVEWAPARQLYLRGWTTPDANRGMPKFHHFLSHVLEFRSPLFQGWPLDLSQVCVLELNISGNTIQDGLEGLSRFGNLETLRLVEPTAGGVRILTLALQAAERPNDHDEVNDSNARSVPTYSPRLSAVEIRNFTWSEDLGMHLQAAVASRELHLGASKFSLELFEVRGYVRGGEVVDLPYARVGVHAIEETPPVLGSASARPRLTGRL